MATNERPRSPREPMPVSERAKIFLPFEPLQGFSEALRAKEAEAEAAALAGFEPVDEDGGPEPPTL